MHITGYWSLRIKIKISGLAGLLVNRKHTVTKLQKHTVMSELKNIIWLSLSCTVLRL